MFLQQTHFYSIFRPKTTPCKNLCSNCPKVSNLVIFYSLSELSPAHFSDFFFVKKTFKFLKNDKLKTYAFIISSIFTFLVLGVSPYIE